MKSKINVLLYRIRKLPKVQGDPNQNSLIQMAITMKICSVRPISQKRGSAETSAIFGQIFGPKLTNILPSQLIHSTFYYVPK